MGFFDEDGGELLLRWQGSYAELDPPSQRLSQEALRHDGFSVTVNGEVRQRP